MLEGMLLNIIMQRKLCDSPKPYKFNRTIKNNTRQRSRNYEIN